MPRSETTLLSRYRQLVQVLASLACNSHEVEAVVQAVHQQVGTMFPAHVTLLALLQPDGDWCWEMYEGERRFTEHLPYCPEGLMESVLHGKSLCVPHIFAYMAQHPARVRRMLKDGGIVPDIRRETVKTKEQSLSMLFVPLETQDRRAGVLSIQSYEPGAFDKTDLAFLELLAQHVAIALENAALREELRQLTRTDALTGLLNRRAFSHDMPGMMDAARRDGRELNLIMLDVHEFKRINDAHGHQVGDVVLATVGQALNQVFAAPNIAFRLSGDEFALLVWGDPGQLNALATQLTHRMRAATWPELTGPLCLQGGVARLPSNLPPDAGLDEWLSLADARMYRAKRRRMVGSQVDWGLDFGD